MNNKSSCLILGLIKTLENITSSSTNHNYNLLETQPITWAKQPKTQTNQKTKMIL